MPFQKEEWEARLNQVEHHMSQLGTFYQNPSWFAMVRNLLDTNLPSAVSQIRSAENALAEKEDERNRVDMDVWGDEFYK